MPSLAAMTETTVSSVSLLDNSQGLARYMVMPKWVTITVLDLISSIIFCDFERERWAMLYNGCQPTSIGFMKACSTLSIKQVFISYNNHNGNVDMERFLRTLKEEFLRLREWYSPFELLNELDDWVASYDTNYLH